MGKKIIDAKADTRGNIQSVRFEGNSGYTSLGKAIDLADKGQIDNAHAVHPKGRGRQAYLRTNPDTRKTGNLDQMAMR